jgi:light-regulated signal transduction histidine kinase (bacteriophytochrome)
MAQIVDDLLNLSRVTRAEIKPGIVDLSEIASSLAYELQQNEPSRQAEFDISSGISVYADLGLMNIVMDNLISNAWKFTSGREAARIEFSARRDECGRTVCFVRDNGVGFDMKYASQLFIPFHRLHSESDFPGTGIGLAIIRRIIERHGGCVWAEARENEGAAFYFVLPDNKN